ncbi:MAG: hypothetical protein ACHREM_11280 [Polyangiales bacterium]
MTDSLAHSNAFPRSTSRLGYSPRVALARRGSGLQACPFCRELFAEGEATTCPDCGVALRDLTELPESADAQLLMHEEENARGLAPTAPEAALVGWFDFSKGRGVVVVASLLGVAAFFLPWATQSAPAVATYTGLQLAKGTPFFYVSLAAFFVLVPMVISRRSILKMVGARLACFVLAAMPAMQAAMLLKRPTHFVRSGIEFDLAWGPGLWLTLVLSVIAAIGALRLGVGFTRDRVGH